MSSVSDPEISAFLSQGTRTAKLGFAVDLQESPYAFVPVQGRAVLRDR